MAEKYFDYNTNEWVVRERDGRIRPATTYETSLGDDLEAGFNRYGKYVARFMAGGLTVEKGIIDKLADKYLTDEEKAELNAKVSKIEAKPDYLSKAADMMGSEMLHNMAVSHRVSQTGDKALHALIRHFFRSLTGRNRKN